MMVFELSNYTAVTGSFRCVGSVRGWCGTDHTSPEDAAECVSHDQSGCRSQGGYSDRVVWLCDADGDRVYTLEYANDWLCELSDDDGSPVYIDAIRPSEPRWQQRELMLASVAPATLEYLNGCDNATLDQLTELVNTVSLAAAIAECEALARDVV